MIRTCDNGHPPPTSHPGRGAPPVSGAGPVGSRAGTTRTTTGRGRRSLRCFPLPASTAAPLLGRARRSSPRTSSTATHLPAGRLHMPRATSGRRCAGGGVAPRRPTIPPVPVPGNPQCARVSPFFPGRLSDPPRRGAAAAGLARGRPDWPTWRADPGRGQRRDRTHEGPGLAPGAPVALAARATAG